MNLKRAVATVALLVTTAGVGLATAGTASADGRVTCGVGNACLYYNSPSYGYGAHFTQNGNISNYKDSYFSGGGAGNGVVVKNHTAYVDNWNQGCGITEYEFSTGNGGRSDYIPVYGEGVLTVTKNNNAAGYFC
ncbi:hypothetical protein AB0K43_29050 [Kitasatospora sp. NPDC049258]|uniref:hypothetical protein n=1 Tax=Kitasatospora sp. NPDC049258 TaxID=3155394 RepID=UPI0034274B48